MWFKVISTILGTVCLLKALIGFTFHKSFYSWDKKQYASEKWPKSFFIFTIYGLVIFFATWYATIFHYVKYGWILTLIVTLSSIKLFSIIFNRKKTSRKFVDFIDSGGWKLWAIDIFVFTMGILFLALATFVYS